MGLHWCLTMKLRIHSWKTMGTVQSMVLAFVGSAILTAMMMRSRVTATLVTVLVVLIRAVHDLAKCLRARTTA